MASVRFGEKPISTRPPRKSCQVILGLYNSQSPVSARGHSTPLSRTNHPRMPVASHARHTVCIANHLPTPAAPYRIGAATVRERMRNYF